ncbi:acyltransferase family protein [Croceibacterium sp. TMG7-5b_MA50]|uniref:acyltransferase family protein n=1 Tax=Croceibacterium sp. TMG7-5b_MA50 TaxID=3121290 RepID=UPI0032216318
MSSLQRFRGDIQGLRTLAVIPVVLFHAYPHLIPGGYAGVDVFFVISGYLISHILLREIAAGQFSIAHFYVRRVRRLFPALYLVLATTLICGLVLLPPEQLATLARTTLGTIFFVSNIVLQRQTGYFTDSAELNALLHTWSLAVEEQFYLFFPIFLYLVSRYWRRWLKPLLWLGLLGSLVICEVLLRTGHASPAFYSVATRAWELLVGCIIAAGLPKPRSERMLDVLSWVGLALIAGAYALLTPTSVFPGLAALPACVGTALVLYAGEGRDSAAGRWLSIRPFLFVGGLSYSLYLWHWPVFVFLRWATLNDATPVQLIAAVAVAFALSVLSWRFVEQPMLRLALPDRRVLAGGVAVMAVVAAACLVLIGGRGLPNRFADEDRAILAAAKDSNPRRLQCHSNEEEKTEVSYAQSCTFGAEPARYQVAVWGDSFGAELAVALGENLRASGGQVIQITSSSCPPSVGFLPSNRIGCPAHNAKILDALLRDPSATHVVLVADYLIYRTDDPRYGARFLQGFAAAAERLSAAGKRLTIVYPVPRQRFSVPLALALVPVERRSSYGLDVADFDAQLGSVTAFLDELTARLRADSIKPADRLCVEGICRAYLPDEGVLYFDDKHLSLAGARFVLASER